jgi:hypothetical protein
MTIKADLKNEASERKLIQKSMLKWENMDMTGRRLGRGLGRKEMLDRVAQETGNSLRLVHIALKSRS